MRTIQEFGVPGRDMVARDVDAIVIALNTRTGPAKATIRQSLAALRWLQAGNFGEADFFIRAFQTLK